MHMEILNINDAGVGIVINKLENDLFEVKVSVTYNFLLSSQLTWYRFEFTNEELNNLIQCLVNGVKSSHGNSSIWQANQILIKKPIAPVHFREVNMYRRFFILGFNLVPATFSESIMTRLSEIKV